MAGNGKTFWDVISENKLSFVFVILVVLTTIILLSRNGKIETLWFSYTPISIPDSSDQERESNSVDSALEGYVESYEVLHGQETPRDYTMKIENIEKNIFRQNYSQFVYDLQGRPLSGVVVKCMNCLTNLEGLTDANGYFKLYADKEIVHEELDVIEICFLYESQMKCFSPRYNELINLIPPKFQK